MFERCPPALALGALLLFGGACASAPEVEAAWPLIYSEDFEDRSSVADFSYSAPAAWRWNDEGGRGSLELSGSSDYKPPFRSPTSIALIPELELGDFDLEVLLLQTGRNYGHRDMCLFLGHVSPSEYYYVHLATSPDQNAHNIFIVNGAPRRNLAEVAAEGIDWGQDTWHRVRLERRLGDGTIRIYWDDGQEPILSTTDKTFGRGRLGFGSFDDTGRIAQVRIWAP